MTSLTASTRIEPRHTVRHLVWLLLALLLVLMCGCHGLKPVELVVAPDAPMLIREVSGGNAKVGVYQKDGNKIVDVGWVKIPVGYTLHKYDWEKFIEEHRR